MKKGKIGALIAGIGIGAAAGMLLAPKVEKKQEKILKIKLKN